jgi:hypothetical protein
VCGNNRLKYSHRLLLDVLSPSAVVALACRRLGVRTLPLELQSLLLEKSQGHPVYIEEVVRSMVEANIIQLQNGEVVRAGSMLVAPSASGAAPQSGDSSSSTGRSATQSISTGANVAGLSGSASTTPLTPHGTKPLAMHEFLMTDTVQGVMVGRVDRLPPDVQLTLKVLAVVGTFSNTLIHVHISPLLILLRCTCMRVLCVRQVWTHTSILCARFIPRAPPNRSCSGCWINWSRSASWQSVMTLMFGLSK